MEHTDTHTKHTKIIDRKKGKTINEINFQLKILYFIRLTYVSNKYINIAITLKKINK